MQRLYAIATLVVISMLYYSCSICSCKKVTCPSYEDTHLNQWLQSFSSGQFLFHSSGTSLDTFNIGPFQGSAEHEATKGCIDASKGCDAQLFVTSAERTATNNPKFSVSYYSITPWDNNTTKNIDIRFRDFHIQATDIADTGFVFHSAEIFSTYQSSISIGGKNYSQVQVLQTDTSIKGPDVYKLYFVKGMGVLAYEEYSSHQLWIRQ